MVRSCRRRQRAAAGRTLAAAPAAAEGFRACTDAGCITVIETPTGVQGTAHFWSPVPATAEGAATGIPGGVAAKATATVGPATSWAGFQVTCAAGRRTIVSQSPAGVRECTASVEDPLKPACK